MRGFLPIPSPDRVKAACDEFDLRYAILDGALTELFHRYHQNTNQSHVLLKVVTLNRLYSAGLRSVEADEAMALHISRIGEEIDASLAAGAPSIVDKIANLTIQGKERRFFSFATKYCNWHRPESYPVYDSRVDLYLWSLQKHRPLSDFEHRPDLLKDGATFLRIMTDFRTSYGLEAFSFKEIDKFLWLRGVPYADSEDAVSAQGLEAEPRVEFEGVVSDESEHAPMLNNEEANSFADEMAAEQARKLDFSEQEISRLILPERR